MLDQILTTLANELRQSSHVIPLFKQAIHDSKIALREEFESEKPVMQLIAKHSDFMDEILRLAWQRFTWNENNNAWRKSRIALVAVGGYGRRELLPHSDIDVMILLERQNQNIHRSNIQSFTTLLWDIGLKVGHSVRSVKDCRSQAASDVTVMTALLEARIIVGAPDLMAKMERQLNQRKLWPAKTFFEAKRREQLDRHAKSDHTEYSLEPNVKTSPGGLRDIQTIDWIMLRNWGSLHTSEMVARGILTDSERQDLAEAKQHLTEIRFALHLLKDADENRLLFEHQQILAQRFGFRDGDQLAVEQFMQGYYRTAQRVNTINDILLQNFDEAILHEGSRHKRRVINERFAVTNDQLEATNENVFRKYPSALLEMFVIAGGDESIKGFRAATIRRAREHIHLINDDFRRNAQNTELFLKILGSNNHLFTQLRRMARWGILGSYLPEFGRVIGQMQFDLFHIYTVDAHTLQVIRNMRRFRYKNNEQQFPVAAHIHPRLPKVELLYIAGFYHDIAKGMGGDHSELGVSIAREFCKRHQLPTWDTNLVCWLVENHLIMSTTAQRKDIHDPEIIREFAKEIGEQVRLDYLYALTVADINATNPSLWNGWKASLMRQLYSETKKALRHGLEQPVDRKEYIEDVRSQALRRLAEQEIDEKAVLSLWNQVDGDYFVRERVSDIVWHTQGIIHRNTQHGPVVLIRDDQSRRGDSGFTQIFIHAADRPELFASIASALDQLGLNIVDAGLATSAEFTFNTFTVLESDGQPVGENNSRSKTIVSTLQEFIQEHRTKPKSLRRTPRILKNFQMPSQISINQAPKGKQTSIEIISPDRPGLLALISNSFSALGMNVHSARITTLGERVEDIFYVTNIEAEPIVDQSTIKKLETTIREALDQHLEKLAS